MTPALVMALVAAAAAICGGIILARPALSEQGIYIQRIAGTMALALSVILALYAWGLHRVGG
ncbi:hypothetical protein [Sphingobium nicotianae]|uniref:Uncharacterized protein n=1 Tax=Sphingobium nicotianae TaxID=2782607 RepID=A0A9X1DD77_9SPHN|nr:hypothetical protein [Sphingobium nicotianae]MBT2187868.1 hypothetical protein [Sphingobium nicotianae]